MSRPAPAQHDDPRIARARTRVANAPALAAGGRYASAERMLRAALGVLERRQQYAGAARAAATLGRLLRERGQTARAGAALQQARLLFDTVETGSADAPGGSLAGGEWEDYQAARALLRVPAASPGGIPAPVAPDAAVLDGVAGDLVALVRAVETAPPAEAPAALCRALRDRLDARSAAAYRLGRTPAMLAAAGDADARLPDGVQAVVGAGRIERLAEAGRGFHTAVPIEQDAAAVGALVLRWTRAPARIDRPLAMGRVAAALLEPDFRVHAVDAPDDGASDADASLLGRSPEMAVLRTAIERAAAAPYPVLIEGETGTGKELVARALHRQGPRRKHPFCAVNCAALTDELFEAELFGHSRGAFTGAVSDRAGLVETADRGTLFLDEVGELSARAQAKLLRVVQEGELRRVGENTVRRVDVQLLAATNRDLTQEVAAGRFRLDLLFRLAVVCLSIPPLRERVGDVEILARRWRRCPGITGRGTSGSCRT